MAKKRDIVSYDPFEAMYSLREDFDRMFKDFFTGFTSPALSSRLFPVMDIRETDEQFIIDAEVPGMDKKDVKLSIKKDELIIEGEKKEEKKEEGESFIRVERSYGSFRRSVRLPVEVDQSKVKAKYENGVLQIFIPKSEKAKPKEIEIKVE
ncbi:Hsp20/alpha crystallin family protein [candidate division WOR-3 bacterium]|nr:Hsp20/alpha crystallin family protein [candidate division WOR-3 bacterium]MCK4571979.1 Hsp20/alpha crystallin family protein [candidate division WOR-3 bacterium]TEU00694.1 MAG: Hsp20/alpha crystallin family protein [Candidatus Stahlbacteria bacterium]